MQLVIKESILDPFNPSDKVELPAKTIELDKTHIKQGADGGWYVEENLAKLLGSNDDTLPGTYGTKYEATATITHPDNPSSNGGSSFTLDTLTLQPIVEKMTVDGDKLTNFSLDGEVSASYNIKISNKKNPSSGSYEYNVKDGEGNSPDGNVDIKLSNKFSVTKQGENDTTLHVEDQNGNKTDYRVSYINYLNKNLTPTEGINYGSLNNQIIKNTTGPDAQLLKTDQGNINDLVLIDQLSPNAMNENITLDTGHGNDVVYLKGNMAGETTKINLGDGDNSLVINGNTSRAPKYKNITAKLGNDIVRVGTNLDSVDIDLGDGINFINVGFNGTTDGYIYGSKVTLGNGNDTILVRTNIDNSTIDTGSGNDIIKIGTQGDYSDRGFFYNSTVSTGKGNDIVSGNYIKIANGFSTTIDLGSGNDQLILNHEKNYPLTTGKYNINMGSGDDTFVLKDTDIKNGVFNKNASIDFDDANQPAIEKGYDTFIYGNKGVPLGEKGQISVNDDVKFDLSKISGLDHLVDISERNFDVTLKKIDFDGGKNGFTATNTTNGAQERIFFIDGGAKTKLDLRDLHLTEDKDKKVEDYNSQDHHFGTDGATYTAYSSSSGFTVFVENSIAQNNIYL